MLVVTDNLNDFDGYQFHDPIASGAARDEDLGAHTVKKNYKDQFDRPNFIRK